MKVMIFCAHYAPGFRAGGPIRSLENLVAKLGQEIEFLIHTADRDFGSEETFAGVPFGEWTKRGHAQVFYAPPNLRTSSAALASIQSVRPDVIYLNSLFHPVSTQIPLRLRRAGRLGQTPVVLAPRGEFASSALRLKAYKKRPYLALAKAIGLYRGVLWQASSDWEVEDIRREMGVSAANVHVAADLHAPIRSGATLPPKAKDPGMLQILLVGRVARMKNIDFALRALEGVAGQIRFRIVGPLEDSEYLTECRQIASRLPESVVVEFVGSVEPSNLDTLYDEAHLFFMPSRGENFGHVIPEALFSGCPVLISDRTPWRGLASKGVGWDLPLSDVAAFRETIQSVVDLDSTQFATLSMAARRYAESVLNDDLAVEANRALFHKASEMRR